MRCSGLTRSRRLRAAISRKASTSLSHWNDPSLRSNAFCSRRFLAATASGRQYRYGGFATTTQIRPCSSRNPNRPCAASALHPLHRAKVPRVPRLKVAKPLLWSTMENRPYQQDALDAISTEYDKGTHRQLLVMATGTGKTICLSKIPELFKTRLPGQTLILAHTEELVEQNRKKIQEANPNLKVGKEMAGDYADET